MRVSDIKIYRKIRYRRGYGVHSPFVYNLITKVIEERSSFYAYKEIENFRKKLLTGNDKLSSITAKETQHPNYGALLFRIVNFFKCRNVLQIGCSTGVLSLYLALAFRTHGECYLLEERLELLQSLKDYALAHNLKKFRYIEGDYAESLQKLYTTFPEADLIFINLHSCSEDVKKIFCLCMPFIKKTSILILNDITRNKEMKNLWKKVKEYAQTRISIDLYALGIVFFDDKLPKRHYKTYFNHGKKQNLHKKRRRRLYFFSRRKKSSKNQFTH
ncbi:MAG: class I SAM-dependent methyltransferase [Dysgonamonadaceae bacterium]|jgi:predicted O-methyltransferase YrrM|nr:class I SAM-dependent methyltransferase [Dysgonamonadaceae bacterium]